MRTVANAGSKTCSLVIACPSESVLRGEGEWGGGGGRGGGGEERGESKVKLIDLSQQCRTGKIENPSSTALPSCFSLYTSQSI